jgi:hypothetical protein
VKINGEPVELVTDFGELRSGMIVWVKPCRWCGGQHRSMLGRQFVRAGLEPNGDTITTTAFPELPQPPCAIARRSITPVTVGSGIVYRVVDPLLDAQTVERKREAVRT